MITKESLYAACLIYQNVAIASIVLQHPITCCLTAIALSVTTHTIKSLQLHLIINDAKCTL